jgi:hypothetical protein
MRQIIRAETSDQIEQARRLFEENASSLGVDLSFQNFAPELPACRAITRCLVAACSWPWVTHSLPGALRSESWPEESAG